MNNLLLFLLSIKPVTITITTYTQVSSYNHDNNQLHQLNLHQFLSFFQSTSSSIHYTSISTQHTQIHYKAVDYFSRTEFSVTFTKKFYIVHLLIKHTRPPSSTSTQHIPNHNAVSNTNTLF